MIHYAEDFQKYLFVNAVSGETYTVSVSSSREEAEHNLSRMLSAEFKFTGEMYGSSPYIILFKLIEE